MSRRPHQQAPTQNSQEESMALRVNAIRRYLYRVNSRYQKVAPPRRASFLHAFIPSFLHSFIPSFLHAFIPSCIHSFISVFPSSDFWLQKVTISHPSIPVLFGHPQNSAAEAVHALTTKIKVVPRRLVLFETRGWDVKLISFVLDKLPNFNGWNMENGCFPSSEHLLFRGADFQVPC